MISINLASLPASLTYTENAEASALPVNHSTIKKSDELNNLRDGFHSLLNRRQMVDLERKLREQWDTHGWVDEREIDEAYYQYSVATMPQYLITVPPSGGQILAIHAKLSQVVNFDGTPVLLEGEIDRIALREGYELELLTYSYNMSGVMPLAGDLATDLPTFINYILAHLAYPTYRQVVIAHVNMFTFEKVETTYDEKQLATNKQALIDLIRQRLIVIAPHT